MMYSIQYYLVKDKIIEAAASLYIGAETEEEAVKFTETHDYGYKDGFLVKLKYILETDSHKIVKKYK